jgi:hypothetical protein
VIFLFQASYYGNAVGPDAIMQWAGVSPGTVDNCTKCVMIGLLLLHNKYIHLSTAKEKQSAKEWVAQQVCLSGVVDILWWMEQRSLCFSSQGFMVTLGLTRITTTC